MPECHICGLESDYLAKCKTCGENFCEECGDSERMCLYCLDDGGFEAPYDENDDDDG
jgi:hypothetical protein